MEVFQIAPLPWSENALEPIISAKTIHHHYHKHHKGYVDKLNAALLKEDILTKDKNANELDHILKTYKDKPAIWNNAAQHFNHQFYWESLNPGKIVCSGKIAQLIEKQYGSLEEFYELFHTKAIQLFGSGWCWLSWDQNQLFIEQTFNAELPKHSPLLVLDVWEHAYYLDYQERRADHIKALLNYLDWSRAEHRLINII